MARSVESQRGSVGLMNFTIGMSRLDASTVVEPRCCTNVWRFGSQNLVKMCR